MKKVRLIYFFIAVLLILALSCSKDDNGVITGDEQDTTLLELFREISLHSDDPTILDIPHFPIPDELVALNDTNVNKILDSYRVLNNFLDNPQILLDTSLKSTASGADLIDCVTLGSYTYCTWEIDKGLHKYSIEQIIGPGGIQFYIYISGIHSGINYDRYRIQYINIDGTSLYKHILYRAPVPPESADEPQFMYLHTKEDTCDIYESWIYRWDHFKEKNIEWIVHKSEFYKNEVIMITFVWSLELEQLYIFMLGRYDFEEMEGEWCAYDEYGRVKGCHDW